MDRRSMLHLGSMAALGCLANTDNVMKLDEKILYPEDVMKRVIPSSNQALPVIGLGTWRVFDAGNSESRRLRLKEVLINLVGKGGAVVDSSPMYGSSESVVGDLSAVLQLRSSLFLATKVWTKGKDEGIAQMNASFVKMQTERVDLMQVHNLVDVNTHLPVLKEWKKNGKIKYIGITHYVSSAYPEMMQLMKKEPLDFVQCNYSIASREAEKELLPLAKDKGIAVIINRPFQEGTLFNTTIGKELPPWAKDYEIKTWAQFFLKFILSNPAVTCVIPGTSNSAHMTENMNAGFGKLPDEKGRQKMISYFESL